MSLPTHSTIAKTLLKEYKPHLEKHQKTPNKMFLLGAEAVLVRVTGNRSIKNNITGVAFCCHDGCNNDASFEIRYSSELEDYTHLCKYHLAVSLDDIEKSIEVIPIK